MPIRNEIQAEAAVIRRYAAVAAIKRQALGLVNDIFIAEIPLAVRIDHAPSQRSIRATPHG
jgi:hypothetical protein